MVHIIFHASRNLRRGRSNGFLCSFSEGLSLRSFVLRFFIFHFFYFSYLLLFFFSQRKKEMLFHFDSHITEFQSPKAYTKPIGSKDHKYQLKTITIMITNKKTKLDLFHILEKET